MPARPRKCCGKNNTFTHTTEFQKWILPQVSLYMLPHHFGSQ